MLSSSEPSETSVVEVTFPATSADVSIQLEKVQGVVAIHMPVDDLRSDFLIVLGEVLNNIVEHAYADAGSDKAVHLRLTFGADRVEVETRDIGRAMPRRTLPKGNAPTLEVERDHLPEGGFGWYLIQMLARDLTYSRSDDQNILRFAMPLL